MYIRNLKKTLNHGLVLKKLHRIIKFKQKAWLKLYIDINTNLRKKAKNDFVKSVFQLNNNAVFGKTIKNVRKQRDITIFTAQRRRRSYLVSSYHIPNFFTKNLLAMEMKKTQIFMNKPVYLELSILELHEILMCEF